MRPLHPATARRLLRFFLPLALLAGAACSPRPAPPPASAGAENAAGATTRPAQRVVLQTDWYAQGEHGGYYQAAAVGYDREEGIELVVEPGGPGAFGMQKVATGQVQFTMGRSDDVMLAIQEGLPVVIVTALMQHDPQALLLHEENPVSSFADLDGKNVMTTPGATFIRFIEARHGIRINVIPLNYGLAQFFADKNFIQQCFITNEPYYVAKNGFKPKTLLIADSGYDPYRVIVTSQRFLRENPEAVRGFVRASARGWHSFLHGDATAAMARIRADNDKMDEAFIRFSIEAMKRHRLVEGDPAKGERIGLITPERLTAQMDALISVGLLRAPLPLERVAALELAPPVLPAAP
jgi:NitT/TauT family transport system substrate-binding protein